MNKKRRSVRDFRGERERERERGSFPEKCFVKYLRSGEGAGEEIACSLGITVLVSVGGGRVVVASPRAHKYTRDSERNYVLRRVACVRSVACSHLACIIEEPTYYESISKCLP